MTTQEKIIQWAKDRKIIPNSSTRIQCLKAVSEIGELADALIKHDVEAIKDAAGDIMVCMYNAEELIVNSLCVDAICSVQGILLEIRELTDVPYQGRRGDTHLLLTHIIEPYNLSIDECIDSAYEVIKDRKGTLLANGVFVKDESQEELF